MEKDKLTKAINLLITVQRAIVGGLVFYVLATGLYKGATSQTSSGFILWTIAGGIAALVIVFAYIGINFSMHAWEVSTDWLTQELRKYPSLRRWIVLPGLIGSILLPVFGIKYLSTEISLTFFVVIYFSLLLPAAVLSLIREDSQINKSLIPSKISRETLIRDPQAALEYSFTVLEDTLRQKVGGRSVSYGINLINNAFGGKSSQLILVVDGIDHTNNLRDLMSGTFSLFRNPRHHRIIDEDEQTVRSILELIHLLINLVNNSYERNFESSTQFH